MPTRKLMILYMTFIIKQKTGDRKGIARQMHMENTERVMNRLTRGETARLAIIPPGVKVLKSKRLMGLVAVWAEIEAAKEDEMECGTMDPSLQSRISENKSIPASAAYERRKAAENMSRGAIKQCRRNTEHKMMKLSASSEKTDLHSIMISAQSSALSSDGERPANHTKARIPTS